jgi:membrane associated rhomboid family serine protease
MSVLEQNSRKKMLLGQDGNTLTLLIIFNAIIFVMLNFVKVLYLINNSTTADFSEQILTWFSVPAQPEVFATRPWTLLISMFTQVSVLHLVSSVLWLWSFGYILQDLAGNKKLIPLYIYGGLAGAIFYVLTLNLIPAFRANINNYEPLLGAGPSLMSIAIATTAMAPRYKIFPLIRGGIPLWILTVIFILISVGTAGMANPGDAGALIAGGLIGYVFVWQLHRGNDWSRWMNALVTWIDDLFNPEKKHIQKPQKQQLYYKANQKPYQKTPHVTQQRIDDLLDKINQKGYHSLSDEEKDFLKKASTEEL